MQINSCTAARVPQLDDPGPVYYITYIDVSIKFRTCFKDAKSFQRTRR